MKKMYSLVVALLTTVALFAQRNVTIQVDMTGQTISANGVHVAGDFQGPAGGTNWTPNGTPMTQVGTSNIYAATVNIPDGAYHLKFINDNDWAGVEGVPAECQVSLGMGLDNGSDNRWMAITSDTTLPAIQFGGCAPAGMYAITFAADLSQEATVADTVSIAGDFQVPNTWTPKADIMYDVVPGSDSVFRYVYFGNTDDTINYKFINGSAWENVPGACAVNGNRQFIIGTANAVASNCINACGACFIPDTFNLTLQVDMNGVCGFSDTLDFAGPFNGWPGSFDPNTQFTDANSDGIYEITVRAPSPEFTYKARFHTNGNTNWEGGNNKVIMFNGDTTVAVRCFGSDAYGPCAPVPAPSDLTFMVDVSQDPNFIPSGDGIWFIGDFTSPAWQGGAIQMTPHSTLPGVFETSVNGVCPGKINFKFVNGDPNNGGVEEDFAGLQDSSCTEPSGAGGLNRFYVRPDDQPQTIKAIYNTCQNNIGLEESFAERTFSIYPNPFTGQTTLQLDNEESYTVSIVDLNGRVLETLPEASGKVTLSARNMAPGVYMIRIRNAAGALNINKVIVQ